MSKPLMLLIIASNSDKLFIGVNMTFAGKSLTFMKHKHKKNNLNSKL